MPNALPDFEDFIESLHRSGWRGINDAQHDHIRDVYNEWKQRIHNCEVSCRDWRLVAYKLAEKISNAPLGGARGDDMTGNDPKSHRVPLEGLVMRWSMQDFFDGRVVIDFQNWTHDELDALRAACNYVNPDRSVPTHRFGPVYFCKGGRWYEGGTHNLVGKQVCRATDIGA